MHMASIKNSPSSPSTKAMFKKSKKVVADTEFLLVEMDPLNFVGAVRVAPHIRKRLVLYVAEVFQKNDFRGVKMPPIHTI
jgi:hypothetical protein